MSGISQGRAAGLIYLIVVASGIFSLAYVPSQLITSGNVEATVAAITSSQGLLRWGIVTSFVRDIAFLLLPFAFYRLLSHVDQHWAVLMVVFVAIAVPISLSALGHTIQILTLVSKEAFLATYPAEQRAAAIMLSLSAYNSGMRVASLFWGLWLFPLGYLVFRSGLLPRALGVLLMLGCFGYLVNAFGATLIPGFSSTTLARVASAPASIGEIGTCLWLVTFGARPLAVPRSR